MTGPGEGTAADGGAGPLAVVVAPVRPVDLDAVVAVERRAFPDPWSRRLFEEELAQWTSRAYRAAWVDRALVAFGGLMFVDDEVHVNNLAVDPDWQGRSLGTALLLDLVRTALDRGSRHLTLEVRVDNGPGLALYRRFGLAPVGVRPGYYPDGVDALVMWVHDVDTPAYARRLGEIADGLAARVALESRA